MALFTKADLSRRAYQQKSRYGFQNASAVLEKAASLFSSEKHYDIFLSHSYLDADEILGLKQAIEEMGFSVYVDWIADKELDRSKVDKKTVELIRNRMRQSKSLFFATSENSSTSKWMPWELGYFDGFAQKVAILPVLQTAKVLDSYYGQEYLGVYPYVAQDKAKGTDSMTLWIHESYDKYVRFDSWLKGETPRGH